MLTVTSGPICLKPEEHFGFQPVPRDEVHQELLHGHGPMALSPLPQRDKVSLCQ